MTMTKQSRKVAITALLFLAGIAMGVLAKALGPLPPLASFAFLAAVIALAGWGGFYCWSLMDEAQQEAHKWAWYWGGSIGMLVGLVAMIAAFRIDPNMASAIKPNGSPRGFVELGYSVAIGSILLGYGVAWAAWWLKRR